MLEAHVDRNQHLFLGALGSEHCHRNAIADLQSGEVRRAHIERSDVAIVPRAAVVGEAMLAVALADALLADLGGDTIGDVKAAVRRRRRRSEGPRGGEAATGSLEALPQNAAEEATAIEGTDA